MLRFDIPPVFSRVIRWEAFIVFTLCLLALLVFSFLEWAFAFCAACSVYNAWYRYFPPANG